MDADEVADIFASFGPVKCRRMFGGLGIYADGVMFALSGFGEIYLKADDALAARLEGEGSKPFAYEGKGRIISLGYWSIPDRPARRSRCGGRDRPRRAGCGPPRGRGQGGQTEAREANLTAPRPLPLLVATARAVS